MISAIFSLTKHEVVRLYSEFSVVILNTLRANSFDTMAHKEN